MKKKSKKNKIIFFCLILLLLSLFLVFMLVHINKVEIIEIKGMIGDKEVFNNSNIVRKISKPEFLSCNHLGNYHIDNGWYNETYVCSYFFQIELDNMGVNNFYREIKKLTNEEDGYLSKKFNIVFNNTNLSSIEISSSFKNVDSDYFAPQILISSYDENEEIAKQKALEKANNIFTKIK